MAAFYRNLIARANRPACLFLLVALLILGGGLALLHRPWAAASGWGIWSAAWTSTTSQHFLDPYSLTHFLHGVLFVLALRGLRTPGSWQWPLALALEVVWELLENSPTVIERYRQETAAFDYLGDSILNSLGDLLAMAVGFLFAQRVKLSSAVVTFILLELLLLWWIRDNLTLNVLQLIVPSDAIKAWQRPG